MIAFFHAMERHRQDRLWIHCAANKRVTAFLGLYRVIEQALPPDRAFGLMYEVWQPDAVWDGFIETMLGKYGR